MSPQFYFVLCCALSLLMFLAVYEVQSRDRVLVEAFARAARGQGYGRKEIAAFQGLNESQWKRQYAAEPGQHVSAYRLCAAPREVMRQTLIEVAPDYGLRAIDERDTVIPLITEVHTLAEANRQLLRTLGVSTDWPRHLGSALFLDEKESA